MSAVTAGARRAANIRRTAEDVRRVQLVTAALGLGSAVVGLALTMVWHDTSVAVWGGLAILCLTPGCAIVCWHSTRDRLTRALAVVAASLTWSIFVATVLAWLQVTSLGLLITLTAGLSGFGSAVFLISQAMAQADQGLNAARRTAPRSYSRPKLPGGPHRSSSHKIVLIVTLAAAGGLWVSSVIRARGHVVGSYGLLPLLGAPFYGAVALTIGALLFALWNVRTARLAAVVALGLLLLESCATQKLLAGAPLYSYVYKHFGVVDYIVHGGALNDPLDVYQQWPGFFAGAAALVRLSGRGPLGYANWAELFFETLNAATLFAIARRFSKRRRLIPYITVLLYITCNWESQEYFAPQTMAFQLALLFQFILLPLLEPERLRRPFRSQRNLIVPPLGIQVDMAGGEPVTAVSRTARIVGLAAVFGAILVTHQLSPYIVFVGVVALWVLGVLRHRILMITLVSMLVAYPLIHSAAIQQNPVLDLFDFSNATGVKGFTDASPPQVLGSDLAKVVCVGIWGATAICGLSYHRRLGVVCIPLIWAAAPLSLVLVSNYGGEGIFRAFLFSSPWCALIIAMRLADSVRAPRFKLVAVGVWALFAFLASAQAGDFGQFPVIQMPLSEVNASAYFLDHAPLNATLVEAAEDFPGRLNARYVLHNAPQQPNDIALDGYPQFEGNKLDHMSPRALALSVTKLAESPAYLVIAPSMYAYVKYYASYTPGTLTTLIQRLKASDYWKLWYQNDGTFIFQALPQGKLAEKRHPEKGKHDAS